MTTRLTHRRTLLSKLRGCAALLLPLALTAAVAAHDLWLLSSSFIIKPGQIVRVAANSGDSFPKSTAAVTPDRVARCALVTAAETIPLDKLQVQGDSLVITAQPKRPGNAIVELVLRPRLITLPADKFTEYLAEEGLTEVIEARRAAGADKQEGRERYAKSAKALLQVGAKDDVTYARLLGHRLEIVPDRNPYTLKVGSRLKVQVIYEGLPLAKAQVESGSTAMSGNKVKTRTNESGLATIELSTPGLWYIHALQMVPLRNDPEADWESSWATLTFEMK